MRRLVDIQRLRTFLQALGKEARGEARVYLTGGASAVLLEWRQSTIDVDLKIEPERDEVLRAIPQLKDRLELNVELASPADFIPELPGWRDRSPFIVREGSLFFHHYDFYSQALSKLERRHARDLDDVTQMHAHGLIEPARLRESFAAIEPQLYRYPAIDPRAFRTAVDEWAARLGR
ncbi:MAG TPA: DUF6036 family nucleotidyltransferase [Thermoanaerobaculia bacterium]|nr:DUF6036 family nucleotidyltransferase [Thermoanaerobaculia bacterium]